jgi:hypothetical protein
MDHLKNINTFIANQSKLIEPVQMISLLFECAMCQRIDHLKPQTMLRGANWSAKVSDQVPVWVDVDW